MNITNRLGLPQSIVDAVANDSYDRGDADYTVTELIKPPRILALERQHAADIVEDASDRIWALMGQAIHAIIERSPEVEHVLKEVRLGIDIDVPSRFDLCTVSGRFDEYALDPSGVLTDYKVTSVWSVLNGGVKPEWEQQINLLALILDANGFTVTEGRIIALLRDWSVNEQRRSPDSYPAAQVVVLPVPLWPRSQQERFLRERIAIHGHGQIPLFDLPHCTPEEMWEKPTRWALTKRGNKKATKLYDDEASAIADQQGKRPVLYDVTKRPGERVRCQNYCRVAPFCSQWSQFQQEETASQAGA